MDQIGQSIPVGNIILKEVAVEDLPLFIVLTCRVYAVDLPLKEFAGADEFGEYLREYTGKKFEEQSDRDKFIKKQMNNALFIDDEIKGAKAWQVNGKVEFKNARLCGFGILKTQSQQFYMFETSLGMDITSQLAAYLSLTYGLVNAGFLPLFASVESRERLRLVLGEELYVQVIKSLGIDHTATLP